MVEIDPWQRGWHDAVGLVDIVALAGNVPVVANEHEGAGAGRSILPAQFGIEVAPQADMAGRIGQAKSEIGGNGLAVVKAWAAQLQCCCLLSGGGLPPEVAQAEAAQP